VKSVAGGVNIAILGKELVVACPDGEREALINAARELDTRMREIQAGGKVIGSERVAMMAALNLSNEVQQLRTNTKSVPSEFDSRLEALNRKIEAALLD